MQIGQTAQTYTLFVGVDIAAKTATVATQRPGAKASRSFTIEQTPEGYTHLLHQLQATGGVPGQVLVVMEATGSYWISLATRLVHDGFAVSVINPAQAHHFAKALLKRAKTDAIDAQTLAQLARVLQPEPWAPPPRIYYALQQRLAQRDDLLNLRQQVRNQLHALEQHPEVIPKVRTRMDNLLGTFAAQLVEVETEIAAVLCQDSAWSAAAQRLQSIKGVGWVTAAWTLVTTLNFTSCDTVDALTAYAGLAPMPRQSGASVWHRPAIGHTGNGRLRTAFYMATLSAAQHNPVIKAFYTRLRETGKPEKVARCAAARKLLHIAWAVVKKTSDSTPNMHSGDKNGLTGHYRIFAILGPDKAGTFARRLKREGESLWTFLDVEGVEATNNIAERAHRFGVMWRKRSQGTCSAKGNRWVERVLSLRHTCRIRGRPTFPILVEAVSCLFSGETPDLSWITQHEPLPVPSTP